jgi:hypothetical protein
MGVGYYSPFLYRYFQCKGRAHIVSIKKLCLNIEVMKMDEINGDKIKIILNDLDGHILV